MSPKNISELRIIILWMQIYMNKSHKSYKSYKEVWHAKVKTWIILEGGNEGKGWKVCNYFLIRLTLLLMIISCSKFCICLLLVLNKLFGKIRNNNHYVDINKYFVKGLEIVTSAKVKEKIFCMNVIICRERQCQQWVQLQYLWLCCLSTINIG